MRYTITLLMLLMVHSISYAIEKREVSFKSGKIIISGTLYLPDSEGQFPAVVFVHGSGAETRGNSRFSAKWLASIGYAALTYDKRGTGESGGDPGSVSYFNFEQLADDVINAVNYLITVEQIDENMIGIHATSQGGWVAALATSKSELISFMIMKSASICTVEEDRIFERSQRLIKEGFSSEDIREAQEMQRTEAKTTKEPDASDQFTKLFSKYGQKPWFSRVYPGSDPFSPGLVEYRVWYASVFKFDPVPYLESSGIPIFWIFGDPDLDSLGPVELSIQNLNNLSQSKELFTIFQYEGESHQVKEKKYEMDLYTWLNQINNYSGYKFKKH